MGSALALRTGLPGTLRADGYDLPPDLTYDEWAAVLVLTEHIASSSPWWLGDAMVYGERRFPDRHSQAWPTVEDDPAGARQSRMKAAIWVSSKFPPVTRVTDLSWTHHRAVAEFDLPEATALLRTARDERWSTRDLVERAQKRKRALEDQSVAEEALCWVPVKSDLTAEARAELERRLAGVGKRHAVGYERGFLDALVWLQQEDCFEEWR